MQAENWKKVKKLLDEALQIEASRRQFFLKTAKVSDEIRAEVESLLAFEEEAEAAMNLSAVEFSKDFFDFDKISNALVGQQIGNYRIAGELGHGGMGAVYLCTRTDGKFEQKVAVKLLRREFNTKKIRQRFEVEKEILSKLNHPNIARLLDTGTTDDGIPFLAMEYIEGEPIDKYCAEKSLDLKSRLKLFNKVCDAVGYAHRNLVIHRDLKPSNILVTENGEPKLLDFGISKLLDENGENPETVFGAMTPEYASPEQIKGENVTTASDIYSLGVVLFNLLTGMHPFDTDAKTNGEKLEAKRTREPRLPSFAAFFREKEIKNLSAQFSSHALLPFSAAKLKGDLDNIVLKSLRNEPERRYKTTEQFATDIWRFLDGLPVSARRATWTYRTVKFYERNKVQVFAGLFIFVSLLAGLSVALRQTNLAMEKARFAAEMQKLSEIETEKANAEKERAEKISKFMSKVISYANPAWYAEGSKYGGNARVIDVLDDLSDKIDTEFEGQADVQAELHHKFAEVYIFAGQHQNKEIVEKFKQRRAFHSLRALELRKQFYGERHELVAKDMFYAYGVIGKNEAEMGKILNEAIQIMRETNPKNLNFPYMLEAFADGLILPEFANYHEPYRQSVEPPTDENNFQIAEKYLREALPLFRFHYKEGNLAIYGNECLLAYTLVKQDKWTDFDEHFKVCKEGKEKLKGTPSEININYDFDLVEKALAKVNNKN
ncbi:MAG TPA: protein kinase [Pyrinomonadaceae bacterium]|nr:protein kinase [Pyrinomonadaceae bacterium]